MFVKIRKMQIERQKYENLCEMHIPITQTFIVEISLFFRQMFWNNFWA